MGRATESWIASSLSLAMTAVIGLAPRQTQPRAPDHIHGFEPAVSSNHQNAIRRHSEDTTMTSFLRLSGLKAITLSAALSMTAGPAIAGDHNVTAEQIGPPPPAKPRSRRTSDGPPPGGPPDQGKETHVLSRVPATETPPLPPQPPRH